MLAIGVAQRQEVDGAPLTVLSFPRKRESSFSRFFVVEKYYNAEMSNDKYIFGVITVRIEGKQIRIYQSFNNFPMRVRGQSNEL